MPLSVVDSYRSQPYVSFLGSQAVQIVPEVQSTVLDLKIESTSSLISMTYNIAASSDICNFNLIHEKDEKLN